MLRVVMVIIVQADIKGVRTVLIIPAITVRFVLVETQLVMVLMRVRELNVKVVIVTVMAVVRAVLTLPALQILPVLLVRVDAILTMVLAIRIAMVVILPATGTVTVDATELTPARVM